MANTEILTLIPDEAIINKIYFIRGQKVMLDHDLQSYTALKHVF